MKKKYFSMIKVMQNHNKNLSKQMYVLQKRKPLSGLYTPPVSVAQENPDDAGDACLVGGFVTIK